jgi:two-component system response regulator HydG
MARPATRSRTTSQVPCDQAGESCPLRMSQQSGQMQRVLHLHHTPRGEEHVDVSTAPIRDDKGRLAFFVETMRVVKHASSHPAAEGLVGRAASFSRMLSLVMRVAPTDAAVLLLGETGTGKELVARVVHEAGRSAEGPFVAVDCSGLTESLFESELFGYEKGAFTGPAIARSAWSKPPAAAPVPRRGRRHSAGAAGQAAAPARSRHLPARRRGRNPALRFPPGVCHAQRHGRHGGKETFRRDLYHRISTFPIAYPR